MSGIVWPNFPMVHNVIILAIRFAQYSDNHNTYNESKNFFHHRNPFKNNVSFRPKNNNTTAVPATNNHKRLSLKKTGRKNFEEKTCSTMVEKLLN